MMITECVQVMWLFAMKGQKRAGDARNAGTDFENIVGRGLGKDVALITDGRFSGATRYRHWSYFSRSGCRWSLALVQDGDEITIDLNQRTLNVALTQEELTRQEQLPEVPDEGQKRLVSPLFGFGDFCSYWGNHALAAD